MSKDQVKRTINRRFTPLDTCYIAGEPSLILNLLDKLSIPQDLLSNGGTAEIAEMNI